MGRVIVCGNIVFDILARPVEEVRWEATTLIENVEQQLGGNAGSTSYTLGKLGIPVSVATLAGRDASAEVILARLQSVGVDLSLVQRVDAATSVALALIRRNGQRALLYQLGASAEDFVPFEIPPDAAHFHLAAVFRMRHLRQHAPDLLRKARLAGLRTSLDTQWDTEGEWMKVLAPSLPWTDYTLLNEDEARELTGHTDPENAARVLRDNGAHDVIIKLGGRGCWVNGVEIAGHPVEVVDTTGAGDCFSGGFIGALQRGMNVQDAARFANAVGALAVGQLGATTGVLDWNETVRYLTVRYLK
jgi:sugar/nucleoside kinase (ribokinase family)